MRTLRVLVPLVLCAALGCDRGDGAAKADPKVAKSETKGSDAKGSDAKGSDTNQVIVTPEGLCPPQPGGGGGSLGVNPRIATSTLPPPKVENRKLPPTGSMWAPSGPCRPVMNSARVSTTGSPSSSIS